VNHGFYCDLSGRGPWWCLNRGSHVLSRLLDRSEERSSHALAVEDRLRRQELYKEFIQEASRCFVNALEHEKPDIASLVVLYEKISRMRILSSTPVIADAEQVLRRIIDTLSDPPITFTNAKVREMFETGSADVLRNFSESCRAEFDALRAQ
jgi:hypothetical protein